MKLKTLQYLVKPRPFALEKPIVIQFPVIDICNSRCQMCKIWENKKSDDITPEDLRKGLSNPLYSEVMSVGLNGGEPTLRADLGELTEVLFETLPKLKNIALITNGYKYKDVIARITDVGNVVKKHGGYLDVMVSLDGYGEMHDKVRGKPSNFQRAQHVIDFLQSTDLAGAVRIGCTIIKENVYGLADLFEYCQDKGLYIKYRLGVPHQRLYTRDLVEPYALNDSERYHIAEFLHGLIEHYETNPNQNFFYKSLIGQLVLGEPRRAGCDWQHRGATITSKGELLYCAVESDVLGKIQEVDSEDAFFSNEPHLKEILATKCASCNHDYVGMPEQSEHRRQILNRVLEKGGMKDKLKGAYRISGLRSVRNAGRYQKRLADLKKLGRTEAPVASRPKVERKKILIGGWYGTETLGDKAILAGVKQAIEEAVGPADFLLASLFPYVSEMTKSQMAEFSDWEIVTPESAAARVHEMDMVVFGGGPMMAINELAEMEAFFDLAEANNIPRLVAGCGVGPLGEPYLNEAITRILNKATWRIYRDQKSKETAAQLNVNVENDAVAEDPAFTWLDTVNNTEKAAPNAGQQVLLLGLRDFPYKSYARHLDEAAALTAKDQYETTVLKILNTLVEENPEISILPLPMCTNHFGDDDRWFYRRLFRGEKQLIANLDLSLLERELPPLDYVAAFKKANAALTMRFHSEVFSIGLGVPTVAIDYTLGKGKVKALSERFNVPHQSLDELNDTFLLQEVRKALASTHSHAAGFKPSFTAALVEQFKKNPAHSKEEV